MSTSGHQLHPSSADNEIEVIDPSFHLITVLVNNFNAYAPPPIIIFGLIGNIFTFVVFLRQRSWDRGMIHYFFFLTISDAACLIIYGSVEWVSEGLEFATNGTTFFDIINRSTESCKIFRYLWNIFGCNSAWLIVCVTAERYFTISDPLRREYLNVHFRKRVILCVFLFWVGYHIPAAVWSYDIKPLYNGSTEVLCTFQEPNNTGRLIFAYGKLLMMYPAPVVIVLILNVLIIKTLCAGRKRRISLNSTVCNFELRVSRTLLIISTAFLVTMVPASVMWLVYFHLFMIHSSESLSATDKHFQELIFAVGKFSNTISMINYSCNCIVYSYQFDFYKATLKRICCFCFGKRWKRNIKISNSPHSFFQQCDSIFSLSTDTKFVTSSSGSRV